MTFSKERLFLMEKNISWQKSLFPEKSFLLVKLLFLRLIVVLVISWDKYMIYFKNKCTEWPHFAWLHNECILDTCPCMICTSLRYICLGNNSRFPLSSCWYIDSFITFCLKENGHIGHTISNVLLIFVSDTIKPVLLGHYDERPTYKIQIQMQIQNTTCFS